MFSFQLFNGNFLQRNMTPAWSGPRLSTGSSAPKAAQAEPLSLLPPAAAGHFVLRGFQDGLPSGSHRMGSPFVSIPPALRGPRLRLDVMKTSSRWKMLMVSSATKGAATRNVSQPELRIGPFIQPTFASPRYA